MKTHCLWLVVLGLGILQSAVHAADWPQWRGPERNGISRETGLLKEWPAEGPKLLWQVNDIGFGYSTPSVVGDRLYLMSNEGEDEFVKAISIDGGAPAWSIRVGKVGNPDQRPPYPGARSTPTVEGEMLYALGSDGDLVCLSAATGEVQWRKSLRAEFSGEPGQWAYSESPLIDGDMLICTPGGSQATLVSLNKDTGDVIWTSEVPGGDAAGYSSAILVEVGGVRQVVQFLSRGLVGVDAATGKFLWRYDKTAEGSPANIPTPVAHDDYIYSAAGRSGGGLVKLKVDGGQVEAEPIYFITKLPTNLGGAVYLDGFLYGTTGQAVVCADFLTGDVKWQDRGVAPGSICYADERLYIHGENGEMALVKATPDAFEETGRFTPPDLPERGRSKAWSHPVVANGRLYVRDLNLLWCYDISD